MTRILLVEDNEMNRDMLGRRLQRRGFDLLVAIDGAQGVAMAQSDAPDLILMDMSLPVMDGWEFLEEYATFCHQLPKPIKIFVLTSSIDEKDRERVASYRFVTGYLTKPLSKEIIAHLS